MIQKIGNIRKDVTVGIWRKGASSTNEDDMYAGVIPGG